VGATEVLAQYRESPDPAHSAGSGTAELLLPPGLAKLVLDGVPQPLRVDVVEGDQVLARASRDIRPSVAKPGIELQAALVMYMAGLGKLSKAPDSALDRLSIKGAAGLPLQIGVSGKVQIYHGASVGLRAGEVLEYMVRTRWGGAGRPPASLKLLTAIQGLESSTLMEERKEVAFDNGWAEAGPFRWTVPANAPGEVRLAVELASPEGSKREKAYVLRISGN
jgi:hypothetical protein